jgi:hypothetical protein
MGDYLSSAVALAQPKRPAGLAFTSGNSENGETAKSLASNVDQWSGHGDLSHRLPVKWRLDDPPFSRRAL